MTWDTDSQPNKHWLSQLYSNISRTFTKKKTTCLCEMSPHRNEALHTCLESDTSKSVLALADPVQWSRAVVWVWSPHTLMYLNTWTPVGGAAVEGSESFRRQNLTGGSEPLGAGLEVLWLHPTVSPLCFVTMKAGWSAALYSCYHAFPVKMERIHY